MRGAVQPWHILILVIVLLVLFGWKKLPDMTRSFGRSARILRSEMDEMKNDRKSEGADQTVSGQTHRANNATPATSTPAVPVEHDIPTANPADRNTPA
ncbi:MAG: Sec-independent protein translocase subunit TatA [Allobranchiibius sp.]